MEFREWLLTEVSTDFPKAAVNNLYNKQIDRLLSQVNQLDIRRELEKTRGFDWTGYIAKSLRSADLPHHDIDYAVQDIVVKLLVQPGTLFGGWRGQPILPRFTVAVRNAVLNHLDKYQHRMRWFGSPVDMDIPMRAAPDEELVERLRNEVARRLGSLALAVLDARLEGMEVKSLVGLPELNRPSAYQIKQAVQQIKALAGSFGDDEFKMMVARAMDAEQRTVARRFRAAKVSSDK